MDGKAEMCGERRGVVGMENLSKLLAYRLTCCM